jgi:hypothetical protein
MLLRKLLKALIKIYAYLISPLTGPNCRFHPTCSHYAMDAIDTHGAGKGSVLALKRILKCHPWHKGEMIDPVPASIDWAALIGYKRPNAKEPRHCGCANHQMKE